MRHFAWGCACAGADGFRAGLFRVRALQGPLRGSSIAPSAGPAPGQARGRGCKQNLRALAEGSLAVPVAVQTE